MADPELFHIILSADAANQLESIFDFISKDSPANASHFIAQLLDATESLKQFPMRQVLADQPPHPYPVRLLPVGNYVIFFRVVEERRSVRIVYVSHGAKRRPKRFPP